MQIWVCDQSHRMESAHIQAERRRGSIEHEHEYKEVVCVSRLRCSSQTVSRSSGGKIEGVRKCSDESDIEYMCCTRVVRSPRPTSSSS